MAVSKHFLLVDTETTNKRYCLDVGLYIIDSKGKIIYQKHIVVAEIARYPLFSSKSDPNYSSRNQFYKKLRMLESLHYEKMKIEGINELFRYLNDKFDLTLCAYNVSFDYGALKKTGIDISIFKESFCLYQHAKQVLGKMPSYTKFCLENGYITKTGKLSFTAETVGKFIYNDKNFNEKHTSYEDLKLERDIFEYLARQKRAKRIKIHD